MILGKAAIDETLARFSTYGLQAEDGKAPAGNGSAGKAAAKKAAAKRPGTRTAARGAR